MHFMLQCVVLKTSSGIEVHANKHDTDEGSALVSVLVREIRQSSSHPLLAVEYSSSQLALAFKTLPKPRRPTLAL